MTATTTTDGAPVDLDADPTLPGMPEPTAPEPPADTKPKRTRRPRVTKPKDPTPAASSSTPRPKAGRPSKSAQLEKQLTELIGASFGIAAAVTAGPAGPMAPGTLSADFGIVAGQASPLAAALVKVSETNPQVRRLLETTVSTGAYGELITVVVGGIAIPIMANHGALPGMFGALAGAPAPEVPPSGAPTP